jgi:membrane protein implicated in regulation of membrane protease activity
MTWESFYLTCFLAGLMLTVVSFLFGAHFHLPVHMHLPDGWHLPHLTVHHAGDEGLSAFNLTNVLMFITWFGGAGYLVAHYRGSAIGLSLLAATVLGIVGAALMYLFTSRVFLANERPLRDSDFEMVGVLGRVSNPIRDGGTGELIYSQAGTRRSCGARSEDGTAIGQGTEVVVMRYERGIAYVRRWDELHRMAVGEADPETM